MKVVTICKVTQKGRDMANKVVNKFPAQDLIKSEKYAGVRDILSALLDKTKSYSFEEVDKIIEKFKKTKV